MIILLALLVGVAVVFAFALLGASAFDRLNDGPRALSNEWTDRNDAMIKLAQWLAWCTPTIAVAFGLQALFGDQSFKTAFPLIATANVLALTAYFVNVAHTQRFGLVLKGLAIVQVPVGLVIAMFFRPLWFSQPEPDEVPPVGYFRRR